jgi:hypothetical protein
VPLVHARSVPQGRAVTDRLDRPQGPGLSCLRPKTTLIPGPWALRPS